MKKSAEGHLLNEAGTNYDKDAYEKAANTADICVCTVLDGKLQVLLIKRKYPPFKNKWAIPGGFVDIAKKESLTDCAIRELKEETGVSNIPVRQLATYGDGMRDPRMRIISTAYYAFVSSELVLKQKIQAGDDADDWKWYPLDDLPFMAFDHKDILKDLKDKIKQDILHTPIAFDIVGDLFIWSGLQKVYEAVLGKPLIAPNFRRKIRSIYHIKATKKRVEGASGRPPFLMKYKGEKDTF